MSATPEQIAERLSTIDGYLNSLWDRAAKLRDQNTGQAHADLNELRHGIGAIPDGLLEAAALIRAQAERVRVLEGVFGHYHVGPGDKCGQCGLDLRDRVHTRAVQS